MFFISQKACSSDPDTRPRWRGFWVRLFFPAVLFVLTFGTLLFAKEFIGSAYSQQELASKPVSLQANAAQPPGAQQDRIKLAIMEIITAVEGKSGDLVVYISLGLVAAALWKKMYRTAVGFLIVGLGVVFVRVMISILFG